VTVDQLRDLSAQFGEALQASLDALGKDAEVHGGGLRHGDVEWHVTYHYDALRRLLIFRLAEATQALILVSAQVAATDEEGHWASAVAGSTSLPRPMLVDQLSSLVPQLLNQARYVANSLRPDDMRPLLINGFSHQDGGRTERPHDQ
jgi:hypothetical protein